MNGEETYRRVVEAQRPLEAGGDECTLLVLRVGGRVILLFHAAVSTSAVLSRQQVVELVGALQEAAQIA